MRSLFLLLFLPLQLLAQVINDATIKANTNTLIRNADPVLRANHSLINDQITDSKLSRLENYSASGTNTYTVSIGWINAYTKGLTLPNVFFTNSNTGASTINVNSLGNKSVQLRGIGLSGNEILANVPYTLVYDGTAFQLDGANIASVVGTTNRITATGAAIPVIDISASYVGQSSITTLGTVTTGVWNGSLVPIAYGGTGTASPGIVAGTNITVTGSWPNQTINASTSGTVAGSDTQVQFNDGGSLAGNVNMTFRKTLNNFTIGPISPLTNSIQLSAGTGGTISIGDSNGASLNYSTSTGFTTLTGNNGLKLVSPDVSGGNAFDVSIISGNATTSGNINGGNVVITLGTGHGTGHTGYLKISGLPTSSAGLPSGALWLNSNVLTIVP